MRKDVERTFGVLRSKFRILKLPSRIWFGKDMLYVMKACVIIHNMIIEDEWGVPGLEDLTQGNGDMASTTSCFDAASSGVCENEALDLAEFITRRYSIQSEADNAILREALIENLWELEGARKNLR